MGLGIYFIHIDGGDNMISETMVKAINQQIRDELFSAYLYLAMSAQFEAASLVGMARWTRMQAGEESEHALKLYDYINERGGRVELLAIDKPPKEFGTPLQTFREVLAHEKKVTALINNLYEIALKENDYATQVMLQWFINEQVEEEKNASLIVDKLEMAGESKGSLLNLDHHIGKREAE
jgi:ferritin